MGVNMTGEGVSITGISKCNRFFTGYCGTIILTHNHVPLPCRFILASGSPVILKLRAFNIEPGGFCQGRMSVSAFIH